MSAKSTPTTRKQVDIPRLPRIVPRSFKQRLPSELVQQALHDESSIRSPSIGSWTRNSVLSEFTGMFADIGRGVRSIGRLVDDPLDNVLGRLGLRRMHKYLDRVTPEHW